MADGVKSKILVVDDEASIAKIVKKQLEVAGYEVMVAADGQAGLDTAKSWRPDLIVLDNMLPKMTGPEVAAALKKDEVMRATPILMLSAKAQRQDEEAALQSGADAYVVKPFQLDEFLAQVRALLGRGTPTA